MNQETRPTLPPRQSAILSFIERRIARGDGPPTIREICRAFRIRSTNGVADHLLALETKGYITREPGAKRGIHVLQHDIRDVCPTCGAPLKGGLS